MKGALFELFFPSSYPLYPPPKIKSKLEDLYAEALNLFLGKVWRNVQKDTDETTLAQTAPPCAVVARAPKSKDVQIGTWG